MPMEFSSELRGSRCLSSKLPPVVEPIMTFSSTSDLAQRLNVLFICSTHNSLSQRLYLELCTEHQVNIEYAISDELMISAAEMVRPDLIICPFLTTRIPAAVYDKYLTLIVHPGPPGDAGPSSLDWLLMGDDGTLEDATSVLKALEAECPLGRSFWGVSIIQAIEAFDAGPIWAWDQFPVDIDDSGLTKSELYRSDVTQAAVRITLSAIDRIVEAARLQISTRTQRLTQSTASQQKNENTGDFHQESSSSFRLIGSNIYPIHPGLLADPQFACFCIGAHKPFLGGFTHHRPLMKSQQRGIDFSRHTSTYVSRRLRSADSQPGILSDIFGPNLYIYGGLVEVQKGQPWLDGSPESRIPQNSIHTALHKSRSLLLKNGRSIKVFGFRNSAICLATIDGKGIWITHIRRLKGKLDGALWPKVPAVTGLLDLGILSKSSSINASLPITYQPAKHSTFQEISINYASLDNIKEVAFLRFDFYNGAMTTDQCQRLSTAMETLLSRHTTSRKLSAVVLLGGSYFSNGIALNTIEAAVSASDEAWANINAINDVVHATLHSFRKAGIETIAAICGNAAAGGVALAASCDVVLAGEHIVLNPGYRASGLFGSEYHTISYPGRCGAIGARILTHDMRPMSPQQALEIGLVDFIIPGTGKELHAGIVQAAFDILTRKIDARDWKKEIDMSSEALRQARAFELGEMAKDFWSPRSARFNQRRFDFVRKAAPRRTPLRFAGHRRAEGQLDEEETEEWDDVEAWRRKMLGSSEGRSEMSLVELQRHRPPIEVVVSQARVSIIRQQSARDSQTTDTSADQEPGEGNPLRSGPTDQAGHTVLGQTLFPCYYEHPSDL